MPYYVPSVDIVSLHFKTLILVPKMPLKGKVHIKTFFCKFECGICGYDKIFFPTLIAQKQQSSQCLNFSGLRLGAPGLHLRQARTLLRQAWTLLRQAQNPLGQARCSLKIKKLLMF